MKQASSKKLIAGLALLGIFAGVLFWFYISAIYLDEASIDLTTPTPVQTSSEATELTHVIYVNASNEISIEGKVYQPAELKTKMMSEKLSDGTQRVILRVNEDARHTILVEVKDILDALNYEVMLELIRTSKDDAK